MADLSWDPQKAREELDMVLKGYESPEDYDPVEQSKRVLQDASDQVAKGLVWMALHSENESKRLDASKYILDRTYGRGTEAPLGGGGEDDMLKKLISTAWSGN